jgi:hypothetical protein
VISGQPVGESGCTLSFKVSYTSSTNIRYQIFRDRSFNSRSNEVASGTATLTENSVTIQTAIPLSALPATTNVLTVYAIDDSALRSGRNAIQVQAVQAAQTSRPADFSLHFGDGRMFVSFSAPKTGNVKSYEIYYGDSACAASIPLDSYADLDACSGGSPPSPVLISGFTAGEKIETQIKGLTNGTVYCVQLISKDAGETVLDVSGRKCVLVQATETLTELSGEGGGGGCFGSVSGRRRGDARGLAVLILPLAAWVLSRGTRRWRRWSE